MSLTPENELAVAPEYWEIRHATTAMYKKAMRDPVLASMSMLKAAKRLGIRTAGKTIVFEDRTDQATLIDYFLHDYAIDGKTILQNINAPALELTPLEGELLEAAKQSSTSLFRTVESQPQQCQIRLLDVLEPNATEITITDVSLSQTFAHWAAKGLVFTRLLKIRNLAISGMFSYVFSLEHGQRMLQALFQKLKNKTEEEWPELKFQFFFQMQRRYGLPSRYLDSELGPAPSTATPAPPSTAPENPHPPGESTPTAPSPETTDTK